MALVNCKEPAPFLRKKDHTPYLDVHHKQRLADDGDDTIENAIALCPNCHRDLRILHQAMRHHVLAQFATFGNGVQLFG
ncbi:HNH endonuclease [Burkholderia ambifaria]|uniref:HNH endonuclease n=1 Tax=Burkholderia ambifaria TaxID=152480 RepID=UPI001FC854E1|nr:HNH endonuclease [Burkholderia ambifaria]